MNNARKPDESKEDYRKRLKEEQQALNTKLKGTLLWNSAEQGTYVKPKDETPEPTK